MSRPLTRRDVLQAAAAAGAWAACKPAVTPPPAYQPKFFTADEAESLSALADFILPPDMNLPGGKELGALEYIDRFFSAFDGGGMIYGGGPYSDRNALPDAHGMASAMKPPDSFATALPLDRVSQAHFKLMVLGPSAVPAGLPNADVVGALAGWRDFIRNTLARVQMAAPAPIPKLTTDQLKALSRTNADFKLLLNGPTLTITGYNATPAGIVPPGLVALVVEAAFAPPEYGGNKNLDGWKIANFEGDSQPLGFSWYDSATGTYSEDPNAPVSGPNPGTDPAPFDTITTQALDFIFRLPQAFTNGKKFF
jgi:hypothetical protein